MVKIGNISFNRSKVEGKTFDELRDMFPKMRIEVVTELHRQIGKVKKSKSVKSENPETEQSEEK